MGLGGVNALGIAAPGQRDAVEFIAELRQAADLATLPVGRDVLVIGGGMTAVDAAVQAKLLGAETVTIAYRRGQDRMGASGHEQDHAVTSGVRLMTNVVAARAGDGGVVLGRTEDLPDGGMLNTGETVSVPADMVLTAIGQKLAGVPEGLALDGGKIAVTGPGRTSRAGVWAGGDCAAGGEDLTVTAVAQGRDAAEDIHAHLTGGATPPAPVDAPDMRG